MAGPEQAGRSEPRDLRAELAGLRSRLTDAEGYLGLANLRDRRAELEKDVSRPDLWDDADHARQVTSELSRVGGDIDLLEDLERQLSDAETLYQLMVEETDPSVTEEVAQLVDELAGRLGQLELRSLFTGEHDERAAVAEVHAGAGEPTPRTGARCCSACTCGGRNGVATRPRWTRSSKVVRQGSCRPPSS